MTARTEAFSQLTDGLERDPENPNWRAKVRHWLGWLDLDDSDLFAGADERARLSELMGERA